jgi:lipocalin
VVDGYAYYKDSADKSKLKVHFNEKGPPFDGYYWVLEVGPLNSDGKYDWAIVSDPLKAFLFVLARDVVNFHKKYDQEIQKKVAEYGFKGFLAPIKTHQGKDCVYEAAAASDLKDL